MLIRHVGKTARGRETRCASNGRPCTNSAKHSVILSMTRVIPILIEKSLIATAAISRMADATAVHTVRNQSPQNSLCVEHALHGAEVRSTWQARNDLWLNLLDPASFVNLAK
jgi:hypothetical protein